MTLPRRSHQRIAALAAAAIVSATLLSACSSTPSDSSSSGEAAYGDFTLQLSWIKNEEFAGEYFAESNGYYTDAGFSSVTLVAGPSTSVAELLSGSADVGLSDSVAVATAIAADSAPLKVIGATFQQNPFTLLSSAASPITSPDDMLGKRIGVQDSNAALFSALLAANDIDASEVTVVPIQYDPAPLVNGEVDAMIGYISNEPITLASQGFDVAQMPFASNGLPFVAETITTTDQEIAENREALKAFLVAEIKGWIDAVNDPEGGAKLAVETYGKELDLDLSDSEKKSVVQSEDLVVSSETEKNGLLTISDALQKSTIASLAQAGIKVKASQLFDLSLLTEVYKENPDLVKYTK